MHTGVYTPPLTPIDINRTKSDNQIPTREANDTESSIH